MTEEKNNEWPMPQFHFSVTIDGKESAFQEVSGLETETQVIEYRHGDSKQFSTIKMPGIAKVGNVTLKRGIFANGDDFWNWHSNAMMNTVKRSTIIIKLIDENGKPAMAWTLQNAWPTKVTGADLKSDGNEVAIESLEIAHEGLTISTP